MKTVQKGDPDCPKCHGVGVVPLPEDSEIYKDLVKKYGDNVDAYTTVVRCPCLELKRFHARVGNAVYQASDLEPDEVEVLELIKQDQNVFIHANRVDFLAHLKQYLWRRDLELSWRMSTDMDLIDIFLGKNEVWPSVASYAKGSDLLILQLGYQSYKNVALSGVVLECLKSREFAGKPTWIVNPHDIPFREGSHLAWSPELEWYLEMNYTQAAIASRRQILVESFGLNPIQHGIASPENGANSRVVAFPKPGSPAKGTQRKGSAKFNDFEL